MMFIEHLLYVKHQGYNSEAKGTMAVLMDLWPSGDNQIILHTEV